MRTALEVEHGHRPPEESLAEALDVDKEGCSKAVDVTNRVV
jgi:hypothetical protein